MANTCICIIIYILQDLCPLVPTNITAISCTVDDTCYNTSNITMDNNGTITANYTGLPDDTMFNTSVLLGYDVDSGDIIQITNNVTTSIALVITLSFNYNYRYS